MKCTCGAHYMASHCPACAGKQLATHTVCAWCGVDLETGTVDYDKDLYLNHGRCQSCEEKMRTELKKLQEEKQRCES